MTIHPPLPAPVFDLEEDVAACRAHLAPLIEDYVWRFPEQSFSLALQPPAGRFIRQAGPVGHGSAT